MSSYFCRPGAGFTALSFLTFSFRIPRPCGGRTMRDEKRIYSIE